MNNNKNKKTVGNVTVYFKTSQFDTFEIINSTADQVAKFVKDRWDLDIPYNSRIYVMDSWLKFLFQSAPVYYWPLLSLNLAFTLPAMKRNWKSVGGWAKRYGRRYVIGIKEKNLITIKGSELGKKIFISEKAVEDKIKHIIIHELTHLCLANHKKPAWFNEGMAMLAVDKVLNKQTVRKDTLDLLEEYNNDTAKKNLLANYIIGYWFVKYLDEKEVGRLNRILSRQNIYEDVIIKEISLSFIKYRDQVIKYFR